MEFYETDGPGHNIVAMELGDACGAGGGSALNFPRIIKMNSKPCEDWQKKGFRGTFLHEWFHIFGLAHMHRRKDRNDYVRVINDNIQPDERSRRQFEPCEECSIYGPYECESIMHYYRVYPV